MIAQSIGLGYIGLKFKPLEIQFSEESSNAKNNLSMNEKVLKCLYDIKFAIDDVDAFFFERPKRFDEYSTDINLKRAVERNLEIICEAMNRILKEDPEFPI